MTRKIKIAELPEFDMAAHLPDEQAIAEYLTVVLEENDPAALADALGTVARARGMTEIAKASGMTREALYKALRADAHPRFETISRVCGFGGQAGCPGGACELTVQRPDPGLLSHGDSQFSTVRPGTRLNSLTLSVTSTAPRASACAAIHRSLPPIGVPCRSSPERILA